jgi:hypothetical protein
MELPYTWSWGDRKDALCHVPLALLCSAHFLCPRICHLLPYGRTIDALDFDGGRS